jgi:transketolase
MTVISPCDVEEARKATIAAAATPGPVYIRLAREKTPLMTTIETPFEIGRINIIWGSTTDHCDVVVFATGPLLYNALIAAQEVEQDIAVTVVNVHTIKPLDKESIIAAAKNAGAVVTVEEHQIAGGMGSAIAELLAAEYPVPIEFVGVHDQFGQSGEMKELIEHYGLGTSHIKEAIERVLTRKR